MYHKIFAASFCLFSSSCAATVNAFKNDPLQHYDVGIGKPPPGAVYAMTGDRRMAVLLPAQPQPLRAAKAERPVSLLPYRFCAESLPDAVTVVTAASRAKLDYGKIAGEIAENTAAALLQTFQRTENAEIYRQVGWNVCLAYAQGAITEDDYFNLLDKMTDGAVAVMKLRAAQPLTGTSSGNVAHSDPCKKLGTKDADKPAAKDADPVAQTTKATTATIVAEAKPPASSADQSAGRPIAPDC